MLADYITYEEPTTDLIKSCLRIEKLLNQAQQTQAKPNQWCSHLTLLSIFDLMKLAERSDLKANITKELQRQLATLSPLAQSPAINKEKLFDIIQQLENTINKLCNFNGKFAHQFRDNEFFRSIMAQLNLPATICSFELPSYHFWLEQHQELRMESLHAWLHEFKLLQDAVHLILQIIRESNTPKIHTAEKGSYLFNLNANIPCQLVRIALPTSTAAFPKVSSTRQKIFIQFYKPSLLKNPTPFNEDVSFQLTWCGL